MQLATYGGLEIIQTDHPSGPRRVAWLGYASARGCSQKVSFEEKATILKLLESVPSYREALETIAAVALDEASDNEHRFAAIRTALREAGIIPAQQ